MSETQTAPMTSWERHLAERKAQGEARFAFVNAAVTATLRELTGWRVERPVDRSTGEPGWTLVLTNGHAFIEAFAPGDGLRKGRMIFNVRTWRSVTFGPGDTDTVTVSGFNGEKTFDIERDSQVIARAVVKSLVNVAHLVAGALDTEVERLRALRNAGSVRVEQFRAAGWKIGYASYSSNIVAYVPEGHALRTLGIRSIRIDVETGEMEYDSRAYLPSETSVAQLVGLTTVQG